MTGTIQSCIKIKALAIASAGIAVIVFAILLIVMNDTTAAGIGRALARFTIIVTSLSIYLWWMDKYGWHVMPWFGRLIRDWPDVRGRWIGTIDRDGSDPPHEFVLEVFQTLTTIRCSTYSQNGESDSVVANITNSDDQSFLVFVWLGGTEGKIKNSRSGKFYGTTELRLSDGEKLRKLDGTYWTDRTPYQTKGRLNLAFEGLVLLKKLK